MLSDVAARKLRPGGKPVSVGGVPGLVLLPSKTMKGHGRFEFRYSSKQLGKRRTMGLGSYPAVGLAEVRRLALDAKQLNIAGIDPIEERKRPSPRTFAEFAAIVFQDDAQRVAQGIITNGTAHSRRRLIETKIITSEKFFSYPIADLTTADFAEILRAYWLDSPDRADRIRQACKRVIRLAMARGALMINPLDVVDELLPNRPAYRDRVVNRPSMDYETLPIFINRQLTLEQASAIERALLFLILTASRSGEVTGMIWDEVNLAERIWRIPAERMKNRRPHIVPLSKQCVNILRLQEKEYEGNDLVFPNANGGAYKHLRSPLVGQSSDIEGHAASVHGFRATFMQWGRETGENEPLLDLCLSHDSRTPTMRAYARSEVVNRRRELLQRWGDYCWFLDRNLSVS